MTQDPGFCPGTFFWGGEGTPPNFGNSPLPVSELKSEVRMMTSYSDCSDHSLSRATVMYVCHTVYCGTFASPAMGHWGTCPLDFQQFMLLWSPYVIGQTIIFLPCYFFLSIFFFSSPNLSGRRLDVYHMMWPDCEFRMQA